MTWSGSGQVNEATFWDMHLITAAGGKVTKPHCLPYPKQNVPKHQQIIVTLRLGYKRHQSIWKRSRTYVPPRKRPPCLTYCQSDDGNCFTPDESDTQFDLEAIKSDEVVLIPQTAITADEWLSSGWARRRRRREAIRKVRFHFMRRRIATKSGVWHRCRCPHAECGISQSV